MKIARSKKSQLIREPNLLQDQMMALIAKVEALDAGGLIFTANVAILRELLQDKIVYSESFRKPLSKL